MSTPENNAQLVQEVIAQLSPTLFKGLGYEIKYVNDRGFFAEHEDGWSNTWWDFVDDNSYAYPGALFGFGYHV